MAQIMADIWERFSLDEKHHIAQVYEAQTKHKFPETVLPKTVLLMKLAMLPIPKVKRACYIFSSCCDCKSCIKTRSLLTKF